MRCAILVAGCVACGGGGITEPVNVVGPIPEGAVEVGEVLVCGDPVLNDQLTTGGQRVTTWQPCFDVGDEAAVDQRQQVIASYDRQLENRENVYILLNKPKGYLSSAADPEGRKLVTDLVKGHGKLHPVGRLDFNTEGLIILTNDGEFTNFVSSSKTIPKVYEVKVKGLPTAVAINKLRRGTLLEDGFKTAPADIKLLKPTDKNGWYEVTLFQGHNQQIRKMFDSIGHSVVKLRRLKIGPIDDRGLRVGDYRKLTPQEVAAVKTVPAKKRPARSAGRS